MKNEFYMNFVEGANTPTKDFPTIESVTTEAHRLAELTQKPVHILKAIETIEPKPVCDFEPIEIRATIYRGDDPKLKSVENPFDFIKTKDNYFIVYNNAIQYIHMELEKYFLPTPEPAKVYSGKFKVGDWVKVVDDCSFNWAHDMHEMTGNVYQIAKFYKEKETKQYSIDGWLFNQSDLEPVPTKDGFPLVEGHKYHLECLKPVFSCRKGYNYNGIYHSFGTWSGFKLISKAVVNSYYFKVLEYLGGSDGE
jgi:hypothetical protein